MRIVTLFVLLLAALPQLYGQAPASTDPQQSLAQAHKDLESGKQAEALALLQKLAAIQPPVKGLQHELGVAYYRTGKLVEVDIPAEH